MAGVAASGVALLALATWRRYPAVLVVGVGLEALAYAASLAGRDAPGTEAVAAGVLLLLAAELAFASLELAVPSVREDGIISRRLTAVTTVAVGGAAAAAATAIVAGRHLDASLALEALGLAAAITLIAIVARLARVLGRRGSAA
jgi:hypothetical protein